VNRVERAARLAASELRARGRKWALVGGLAVSARAEPRTTRDVDIAVHVVDDTDAEALVGDLRSSGFEVLATVEHAARGRLATVRLAPPGPRGAVVDLLFASSGIEPEVVQGADELELVRGLHVPVASTGHLIALKVLARDDARRPHDIDDLRRLLDEATPEDIDVARRAARTIAARGYDRGRDLAALLEALVASHSGG
jgi:predicted nucleotidyltransferase